MKLLVFCEKGIAYNVPKKIIELSKIHDINYDEGTIEEMNEAIEFFKMIQENYKPILIGHLLTGDIK